MGKFNAKSLVKLIENLVDKLVETKVERLVEERLTKLTPMLVEHEVNRLLREYENDASPRSHVNGNASDTGNKVADEVMEESGVDDKKDLREHFRNLIGGGDLKRESDGSKTISYDSSNVGPNHTPTKVNNIPDKGPDGNPIDTSNPQVKKVADIINQDFSGKLKDMRERSKKRGGQLPQGGH